MLWKDRDPNCAAFLGKRGDRMKERRSGQIGRGVGAASSQEVTSVALAIVIKRGEGKRKLKGFILSQGNGKGEANRNLGSQADLQGKDKEMKLPKDGKPCRFYS